MLKIITVNVNGLRSAARKGFFTWLQKENADIICLQEIKAHESDLQDSLYCPEGYSAYYHCAEKKGYSGVAILSRHKPTEVKIGLEWESANSEGRFVALTFDKLTVASLYMPSGTAGDHRQEIKYDFLDKFGQYLQNLPIKEQSYIICGDLNIAHKPIDLKNWRANQKNTGFLPEERQWMDKLFSEYQFVDAFREVNPEPDQYTWWSNRGRAWEKNVGWRIDYQVVSEQLKNTIKSAAIYKAERFSDHAPLIIEYDIIVT